MTRRPTISMAAVAGAVEAMEQAGRNPDDILHPLGLSGTVLSTADGRIPAVDFTRALETAARATDDDCFGLHLGEHFHPKNAGPIAYVALNAPTMAAAFADISRYLHVLNEAAEIFLVRNGSAACLRHTLDLPGEPSRQHAEFSLAVTVNLIRLMVGGDWRPVEAQFLHRAPASIAEHRRVFRAPVTFACAANALVLEPELVEQQVPGADRRLYPVMERYLDRILQAMPREDGLIGAVRKCLGEALREGAPTLGQVAAQLGVSARTLQRQLHDRGVDFSGLVEDTRRRFAMQYLDDRANTLTDVAFLLGYSEVSAFNRAFKRWTGSTPSGYRRRRQTLGAWRARTTKVRSSSRDRPGYH